MKPKIFKIHTLIIATIFISVSLFEEVVSNENKMEIFRVPFNYFDLPVPKDWHFLNVAHLGERQYMFSPNEISLSQLMQGVDLEALLTIKILTMDTDQINTPIEDLLKNDIDYRISIYKSGGTKLSGKPVGPQKILDIDGFTASLAQPDEKEFLFLGKRGRLLYEVHYSFDMDKEANYLPTLEKMVSGLHLLDSMFIGRTKNFTDNKKNFSILLPTHWHVKDRDDGKVVQMYISREKLEKETDIFKVGVTCTKIRRFSKSYPQYSLKTDEDIINLWASAILGVPEESLNKIFEVEKIQIGNKSGIVWERSFKSERTDFFIQEYHLVLAKNDILFDIILEAPVMEFEIYRNVFLKAIDNLKM